MTWKRAVDMNDRALRQVTLGLGGAANGYPRETGFDITAASEVMAILAVARDLQDLRRRMGANHRGYTRDGEPVTAEDLGAAGAMTVLLKDAIKPNLIQTLEGQPCLMHAGPFANIAHGNSSLIADLLGLKLGDYVITESGFGSDMGMEKFIDIVCRAGGIAPDAIVLVATVRALKHHGGLSDEPERQRPRRPGGDRGRDREPERHLADRSRVRPAGRGRGQPPARGHRRGGRAGDHARQRGGRVRAPPSATGSPRAARASPTWPRRSSRPATSRTSSDFLYDGDSTIKEKIEAIAKRIYGASEVVYYLEAEHKLEQFDRQGLGRPPGLHGEDAAVALGRPRRC